MRWLRDGALDLAGQAAWQLETELLARLREAAEEEAIRVFAPQPARPAAGGARRPAREWARSRHPHRRESRGRRSHRQGAGDRHHLSASSRATTGTARCTTLAQLANKHGVELIGIGNGTASRETDKLAAELIKLHAGTAS